MIQFWLSVVIELLFIGICAAGVVGLSVLLFHGPDIRNFGIEGPAFVLFFVTPVLILIAEDLVMFDGVYGDGITVWGGVERTLSWVNWVGAAVYWLVLFPVIMRSRGRSLSDKSSAILMFVAIARFAFFMVIACRSQVIRERIAYYDSFSDRTHIEGWYVYHHRPEYTLAEIAELEKSGGR